MNNDKTRTILKGVNSLRPWPPVAMKVMELSRREEVSPAELVAVLKTDAAMTARVLMHCNSAHYGFQREVHSLQEAGVRLGSRALVSLVLTSCLGREFSSAGRANETRGRRLWERSLMNALAASYLARVQGRIDRHAAYTAALLQNMGHLVIQAHFEDEGALVHQLRQAGARLVEAEREVYGMDHAQIGALLAKRWNFPELVVDTIAHHHEPTEAHVDPVFTSITHLAESITNALALGEGLDELAWDLSDRALGLSGFSLARLAELENGLLAELGRARELVNAA